MERSKKRIGAKEGNWFFQYSGGGSIGVLTPIFWSLLYNNSIDTISNSLLTFNRLGTATYTDFEGLIKTIDSGEVRYEGARRVKNLLKFSEDFSQSSWVKQGTMGITNLGNSIWELDLTSIVVGGGIYQQSSGLNIGGSKNFRLEARVLSGTGTLQIADPSSTTAINIINLTSSWQIFSITEVIGSLTGSSGFWIRKNTGTNIVQVRFIQLEDVTGQANQNPSEYVRTDSIDVTTGTDEYSSVVGDANVTVTGTTITKASGTAGWNAQAYSTAVGNYLSFKASQPDKSLMIGLNSDPIANSIYTSIDYAIFINNNNPITIYENGSNKGVFVTHITSDILEIVQIGNEIHYKKNGTTFYKSLTKVLSPLYFDSSFLTVGGAINSVQYRNIIQPQQTSGVLNYDTLNGNTVLNNVVTENTGANISQGIIQGAVIEPQVTNLALNSETFTTGWTMANAVITSNQGISPRGDNTLALFTQNTSANNNIYFTPTIVSSTQVFTQQIYLKKGTRRYVQFSSGPYVINFGVVIDLNTGTITSTGTSGTGVYISSSIKTLNNGIYHIVITGSLGTIANPHLIIQMTDVSTFTPGYITIIPNNGATTYLWGAMHELGAIAHNYIPTTTTAVTKPADIINYNTITGFPTTDISIIMGITPLGDGTDYIFSNGRLFGTNDSRGINNELRTFIAGVNTFFIHNTGGGYFQLATTLFAKGVYSLFGFTLKSNGVNIDWQVAHNGVIVGSGSVVGTLDHSNLGNLQIGNWNNSYFSGNNKNVKVFNSALTSTKLITETTP